MFKIYERKQIGNGIWFCKITDRRFKVNRISVSFYTEVESSYSRADYAIVPYILVDSCEKYPDYSQLSLKFSELYGASMSDNTSIVGDVRCSSLAVAAIDNRFALENENIELEACRLLLECLLHPLMENGAFSAETTRLMQSELIDSIDSVINDKRNYAAQKASEYAYKDEPWGLSIQGTHDEAERVTPQSAYGAYCEMLRKGRIEISVVGCSDFTDSEKLLTEAFLGLQRGEICQPHYLPSAVKSEPVSVSEEMPMKQAILRMYFKAPEAERFPTILLSMILGGMTTSRFFTNIREKQSLCYYCGSFSNRFKKVITVSAGVDPENVERTKQAVLAEFRDICDNGVNEQELSRAKLEVINDARSVYDGVNAISAWYGMQLMDGETITPEQFIERVNAVTAEQVQAVCRKFSSDTFYALMPKGGEA